MLMYLLYFLSNKCRFGEHKNKIIISKTFKDIVYNMTVCSLSAVYSAGKADCVKDVPVLGGSVQDWRPGLFYGVDDQCRIAFGSSATACSFTNDEMVSKNYHHKTFISVIHQRVECHATTLMTWKRLTNAVLCFVLTFFFLLIQFGCNVRAQLFFKYPVGCGYSTPMNIIFHFF